MKLQKPPPRLIQDELVPKDSRLAGFAALVHEFDVAAPLRAFSCVAAQHIGGSIRHTDSWAIYDKRYAPDDSVESHLTFALRHEPLDLLMLKRILTKIPAAVIASFVQSAPNGIINRRLWFLYEFLLDKQLDIPNAGKVKAVDVLPQDLYCTTSGTMSTRHKVNNNLLGTRDFCPIIRRTERVNNFLELNLHQKAAEIVGRVSASIIGRAAGFLLLADTKASFEIEGERPARTRLERWLRAVQQAGKRELSTEEIERLHSLLIEDDRFVERGLRSKGNFIGERTRDGDPIPEWIGARPEDLQSLLAGLCHADGLMGQNSVDAVLQATAISFGFVFIHPLEDGNGRLSRYLIHHVLAERRFTPPGIIFPVSSVMRDETEEYQRVLQNHSAPLLQYIEWAPTAERNVEVNNDTADFYRYFDCTEQAEFLYHCVQRTVEKDFPREVDYLKRHDTAKNRLMERVEMPDHLAEDFLRFVRENEGQLSKRRREREFAALGDEEVVALENIVVDAFDGFKD